MERLLVRQQVVQHSWKRSGSATCMYTFVEGPKMIKQRLAKVFSNLQIASTVCVGLLINLATLLLY